MFTDLRHLVRSLRRSPASAGAAILTLSLTLGAGTSILAMIDAVLLTPPPFANPDALFSLGEVPIDGPATSPRAVPYATFEAWRDRGQALASLEAFDGTNLTMTGVGPAERVSANDVTPGFLKLLGVVPARGRGFEREDIGGRTVILSHSFWRERFNADSAVIGRPIVLGGQAHTIVGILPEQFVFGLSPSDLWRPLPLTASQAARSEYRVGVVGRVVPHASPASLALALNEVSRASSPTARVSVVPIATAISGDATRPLVVLSGAVGLALLIAFTNFAGLSIVRSIDRRQELAVRSALGAGRFEISRQLFLEAQMLVVIGVAGGIVLALWLTPLVARLALEQFGSAVRHDVAIGWRVVVFVAIAASTLASACALVPATMAARWSFLDTLRRGVTPPPRELILRRVFVAGEVALAFVLLACVTMLGRTFLRLLEVNPGFDARRVLVLQLSVPAADYSPERVVSFYTTLQHVLEDRLGPRSVAVVNEVPLTGDRGRALVRLRPNDVGPEAVLREAGPAYFDVMRIPVLRGRSFEGRDDVSAPARVVISRSLSERLFGSEESIGRQIWLGAETRPAEVVGVVGDVTHRVLDEARMPTVYRSAMQSPSRSSILVVRSAAADADVIATVRGEVARLDGNLPVYRVRSMQDVVAASAGMPARRVLTATLLAFALLALVLGAVGLFGVIAHDVASRRMELALRMALGAAPGRIVSAMARQGALMLGAGVAVGSMLAMWALRMLGAAGFATAGFTGVSVAVPAALLVAAGAAAILPAARRAARTDPLIALRGE